MRNARRAKHDFRDDRRRLPMSDIIGENGRSSRAVFGGDAASVTRSTVLETMRFPQYTHIETTDENDFFGCLTENKE
jgi:hypothetical protein